MNMSSRLHGRVEFLGLRFDDLDQDSVLRALVPPSRQRPFAYVVTPNVDHVVGLATTQTDDSVRRAYDQADLVLCDSRILQMLAGWSRLRLPLVTGSDLTVRLLEEANAWGGMRIAVVGGDGALLTQLESLYPEISWHQHIPPMGVRRNAEARQAIAGFVERTSADYILLAIGAPQSELVCAEIAQRGNARGMALCIGASLEFVTGAKRRAPAIMQALRLEWLFRLLSEPRRLWRRYLVEGPRIIAIWLRWRASRPLPRGGSGSSHENPS